MHWVAGEEAPDNLPDNAQLAYAENLLYINDFLVQPHPHRKGPVRDAYFPLRTPTPTLVLRDLVPMDILFLVQERHNRLEKLSFLGSYIDKFQNTSSSDISLKVDDARLKRRLIFRQLSLLAFALAGAFIVIGGGFALL